MYFAVMGRKANKITVVRRLFALSGNLCAYPGCQHELINSKEQFVAEICHIEGANPGSARFNHAQSDEERRSFENLLLLCHRHHVETDDESEFSVTRMQEIKAAHEKQFATKNQYKLPTDIEDRITGEINAKLDTIISITTQGSNLTSENNVIANKILETVMGMSKVVMPSPEKQDDTSINAQQLEFIKDLKKIGKYTTALDLLLTYKDEKWDKLTLELKFKTIANIAVLYMNLQNRPDAIKWMQRLKDLEYEHPDRYAYLALSYGLQKDIENFEEVFTKAKALGSENSNLWLGYIHVHPEMDAAELITAIPDVQLHKSEILFTLADRYYVEEKIKEGNDLIEQAAVIENKSTLFAADMKAFAATKSLPVLMTQFKEFQQQYSESESELLKVTLDNLSESWNILNTTELVASRWYVVLNRGVLYKILGKIEEAIADFQEAFNLSNAYLPLKNLVLALLIQNKTSSASKVIEEFLGTRPELNLQQRAEIVNMKSRILLVENNFEEAVATLETLLCQEFGPYRKRTLLTLSHNCFEKDDLKRATSFCKILLEEYPEDLETLSVNAHLQALTSNTTEASKLLDKASKLIGAQTNPQLIFEIAIEYFDLKEFDKARPLLLQIANTSIFNGVTRALVLCYYNQGDTETALVLAQPLFKVQKENTFLAEIVTKCYEEQENYEAALNAAESYIDAPQAEQKDQFRFHAATICFHIKQLDRMSSLLRGIVDTSKFQQDASYRIAYMYSTGGEIEKGLELAYQTRSKYYDDGKSHLAYMQVLNSIKRSDEDLFPTSVRSDSGIELEDSNHEMLRYLISDQQIRGENIISPHSGLARSIIGKKKGEPVVIDKGFGLRRQCVIKNIFNKYTYAYQESVNLFSTRFVGEHNVTVMKINNDDPFKELEEMVRNQTLEKESHEKEVFEFYRKGQIPLTSIALLFKENFVKHWGNLLTHPDFYLIAFINNNVSALAKAIEEKKPVVLDITALLSLGLILQSFELIECLGVPLYTAQATVQEIQQFCDELEVFAENGRVSLHYQQGKVVTSMMDKDQIIGYQDKLKALIDWCNDKTTVSGQGVTPGMSRETKNTRIEAVGKSCFDTVSLAERLNGVVLSDDAIVIANVLPHGIIGGFSVFDIAMLLRSEEKISAVTYDEIYLKLIGANYISLPATSDQVWAVFDKAQFQIRKPFTTAAKSFSILLPAYAAQYSSQFLKRAYTEISVKAIRTQLSLYIFSELFSRPDKDKIAEILVVFLLNEFRLLPVQLEEVFQLLKEFLPEQ
ncbi:MAG: hypothetical protein V4539_16465 [Bacteroidota bacterium]